MMAKDVMLTTIDNPFDPFKEFDEWFRFDTDKGYHTCSYLGRIAKTSPELSEKDTQLEIENAIDDIVRLNVTGLYKKVTKED
jgi:hypothetical protein